MRKIFAVLLISLFFFSYSEGFALARAGGGRGFSGARSYGSRGTRTYIPPVRENNPTPGQISNSPRQVQPPVTQPPQPVQSGGGFFRSLAGGILGGFIGGMLFRSLGYGGFGFGGLFGGIGFFEIALAAFIIFMIYRLIPSGRQAGTPACGYPRTGGEGRKREYQGTQTYYGASGSAASAPSYTREDDVSIGLERIRQFDPSFDEAMFRETATEIFFKVQSAWKNRDIESSRALFAPEIRDLMLSDIAKMRSEGRVNRLENIAMRGGTITEAWQEEGKDYITVKITANVLDYVTDESDRLVAGSRTEPVKFVEYWTFVRTIGKGGWQLSAIQQDEG